MGCASSKRIEATIDIYRPAPASFAVFDINAIQEPWLTADNTTQEQQEKPAHVPAPILEKLNKFESDAPHSWDEVRKALEDLKPSINNSNGTIAAAAATPPKPVNVSVPIQKQNQNQPRKSLSFHTLEELDEKLSAKPAKDLRKTESMRSDTKEKTKMTNDESRLEAVARTEKGEGFKSVKDNIFIVKDRMEREREGRQANYDKLRRDPLSDFPEKCPPGGADSVVVYTTSLRGVRRTFEDCSRVRSIFEVNNVVMDERDVSLHGDFLNELKDLVGEEASVPRVFVKGRYIGGADELTGLNESGKLGRILRSARVEIGIGRQACEGCGGARFVPCLDCGGSCKVLVNGEKERCGKCNENGLIHCPACCQW
ncbi:Glutaredoxin [Melia azedarach]|uniref:Glutaredoxin n=1 Tax=Melia azedarach TaxID=155640 RepID=A0ACC1XLS5_MELAZ|nr:Glutaredoxin [Melia azedarach]